MQISFRPLRPALFALLGLILLATPQGAEAQDRIRYIAFGDSITEAVGFDSCPCDEHECRQLCGYPRRLKNRLIDAGLDVGVLNFGLGGERTPEGLTRLDEVLGEYGGQVLLLMEGTNDITRPEISPETTLANLEEMARKASRFGLETIHATLIPRFPQARVDPENVVNARIAGEIRDLAFTAGRRLADPYATFSSQEDLFEQFYAAVETDPVGHPNAAGFDLLAETFFNLLTGVDDVSPVLGSVEPMNGTEDVSPFVPVRVRLYDFGTGLDAGATRLFINDEPVGFESSSGLDWQDLVYRPADAHPVDVAVRVAASDLVLNAMEAEATRFTVDLEGPAPCFADETTLCIDREPGDQRFKVTLHWETGSGEAFQEGDAAALPLASIGLRRGGLFSFFELNNPEVLIKVLDGCAINGHFWIFVAPTTTLGYELRVVDTAAALEGAPVSEYLYIVTNRDGEDAPPVSDTGAFATCEFGL